MHQTEEKIITFENFTDPVLAEIIKGKLEANNISCFLKGSANQLLSTDGVQLMIFEKDLEKARKIRAEEEV